MNVDPAREAVAGLGNAAEEPHDFGRHHEHFRTDHLRTNLKQRAISSGFITSVAQVARMGLYMGSAIILRRLVSVKNVGLFNEVMIVVGFVSMFKDAGFSTATIQNEKITHKQVSNLFWINVGLTAVLSLIVAASAPLVARFGKDPQLTPMTIVLSVTFLLGGLNIQHQALLNRQMRFKATALIDVGSMVVSLLVGATMAVMGLEYWALVGGQLALSVSETVLTWWASSWRPQLPARCGGTWALLGFGGNLTGASLLRRLASQAASCLLIWRYDAESLAIFNTGWALLMRPLEQFLTPFDTVFVPLLSRLQEQPGRYRQTFLQVYNSLAMLSFPIAGLFLGLSKPLILVLLTEKWALSAPVFAALTVSAIFYPVGGASMWLLTTQGRGRDYLTTGMLISILSVIAYVVGLPYGPKGVALAFSLIGLLVRLPIQYYIVGRSGPVSTRDLWSVFLKYFPVFFVVYAVTFVVLHYLGEARPIIQLLAGGFAGTAAGVALISLFKEQRELAQKLFRSVVGFATARMGKAA